MASRIGVFGNQLAGHAVGPVLTLTFFVLNHPPLLLQLLLGDGPQHMSHAIRFHPQDQIQRRGRNILEIIGAVIAGGSVQVGGSHPFQGLKVIMVEVFTSVEHEMFKQVGKAASARTLVLGADVIPDIDGHDGHLVILVNNQSQSIAKHKFLIRYIDLPDHLFQTRGGGQKQGGQTEQAEKKTGFRWRFHSLLPF